MPALKHINKFVILSEDLLFLEPFLIQDVLGVVNLEQLNVVTQTKVLVVDFDFFKKNQLYLKSPPLCEKLVLIYSKSDEVFNPWYFRQWPFQAFYDKKEFSMHHLQVIDKDISEAQQQNALIQMTDQLNSEYEKIKNELEQKIKDKKKCLIESRQKILDSNNRIEALRKILYSFFQESDLNRIETTLNELLPTSSKAVWIKIITLETKELFESELKEHLKTHFRSYPISGHFIFFIKADNKPYKKEDLDLFSKICDIIDINYLRDRDYKKLVLTEKIVSTAFEKFHHPLAIIDKNYSVLKGNELFNIQSNLQKKCYKIQFNREEPCQNCHLGQRYQIEENGHIYDVVSNRIHFSDNHSLPFWVNLYLDKTEEHYFESRLRQNAKMKELGIVSSSIAHELNNPLGGLISYLQLLAIDLPKDHAFNENIKLMTDTSLRIKKIIEDLLVFSRKPKLDEQALISVASTVKESLSMHDLQFKNHNIKIVNHTEKNTEFLTLSASAFRDTLHYIYNYFIEKISAIRKSRHSFTGLIEIKFYLDQVNTFLELQSNCGPISETDNAKDISLLALNKIASDQNLNIVLTQPKNGWISLKVIIPKS